jgi:thiol-disulfide isomerase/thioredoxin
MPDLSPWQDYKITSAESVPLDLQPGQRVSIDLGSDGGDVTGKVALKGMAANDFDFNYSLNYLLRKSPGIDPPPELRSDALDWRRGWSDAWRDTSEGGAYLNTLHHYFVKLNHDGTFRVCGVPPGDYDLALRIYERPKDGGCLVIPIGSRVVPFRVPQQPDKAKPFDLGTLEIQAAVGPKPGEVVPDFEFETLDRSGVTDPSHSKKKLSDLRGKYLLIDFWATWCQSCVAALPDVQRLHEKFGRDGRLTIVSISVDDDRAALERFVEEHKLAWLQGYAGSWRETKLLQTLGISSVPAYLLIDPDGKLIESVSLADGLDEKLTTHLRETRK